VTDRRPEPTEAKGDAFIHERASATPRSPVSRAGAVRAVTARRKVPAAKASLRALQEWFEDVITNPGAPADGVAGAKHGGAFGVRSAKDLERVVTAGPRQTALRRLAVYHHAYRARLVEVLADDFPSVQRTVGEDAFEALCHAYVEKHPSRDPNLNHYGKKVPAFLAARRSLEGRRFLSDLAALEWAMIEAIHAPDAAVLDPAALASVPPERWAYARLPKSDSLRILRFAYPANRYLQALRDGKGPSVPAREASATAVYRHGKRIWRMDLTPAMAGLLDDLFAGQTLGEALGSIEAHAEGPDALAEAERQVMVWFRAWVEGGFFARVEFDDESDKEGRDDA
jgi:hypothetical protein